MNTPRRRLRQSDIAAQMGVSISTVSRALANDSSISDALRHEVQRVAKSIGYRAQEFGVRQRDARRAVALVPLERATGALAGFYEGVVAGLRAEAHAQGLALDVRLFGHGQASPDQVGRVLGESGANSLLLVGFDPSDELAQWVAEKGVPLILVNGADPRMRFSSVSPSNFYGARMATEYLLEAGHRTIAHLSHNNRFTIYERTRGFEAAIAAVPGARSILVHVDDRDRVKPASKAIAEGATALFFMNDLIAVDVLESPAFRKLDLPKGFSAIGFDDLPCASMISPRLSTIAVDREAVGRAGVRLLLQALDGDRAIQQLEMGVSLVKGATVHKVD